MVYLVAGSSAVILDALALPALLLKVLREVRSDLPALMRLIEHPQPDKLK